MKTVFTNRGVCHAWASQKQAHGKSDSIFFEGPSIYSYGRHFEAARFIAPGLVFITSRHYSVTTSKHLSLIRQAVRHEQTFTVLSFTDHAVNLAYYFAELRLAIDKAQRAKTWAVSHLSRADELAKTIRAYRALDVHIIGTLPPQLQTDLRLLDTGELFASLGVQDIERAISEAHEQVRIKAEKERLQRTIRQAADLERWKQGETVVRNFETTALRVVGDIVQTTHGATVPVIEARKLYRALHAGVNVIGQRIGLFTVSSVTDTAVIIGCHTIPRAEIERIAPIVMAWKNEAVLA